MWLVAGLFLESESRPKATILVEMVIVQRRTARICAAGCVKPIWQHAVLRALQVFAMPIFDAAETAIRHALRSPPRPLTLRLLFRSSYVVAVTFTACLLPFFHELMVGWELVSGSAAQVCWCWCWCGSTTGG